jgi:methyl-accepting chemotaxis protein
MAEIADGAAWVWQAFSVGPGLLALAGAAIGYGRLQQRMQTLERDVERLTKLDDKVGAIVADMARVDERTKNIAEGMEDVKGALEEIRQVMQEARSFSPPRRRT